MADASGARLKSALLRARRKGRAFAEVLGRFAPYLQRRQGRLGAALGCALAYMLVRLLEPWPLKLIIDNVLLERPPAWFLGWVGVAAADRLRLLYVLAAAVVGIAATGGLLYYWQRLLAAKLGLEIIADLRLDVYRHLQGLPFSFHDRRRTGDLLVRITSDIRMLRQGFITLPILITEDGFLLLGMTIVMFVMDWQLTLLALLLLPVLTLIVRRHQRPMKQAIRKQREREGNLATIASEALGAIRVVQGFRRERHEVQRFGSANRKDLRSGLKAARHEAKLKWSADLAVGVVTALIVALSTRRVLSGSLSPGDLIVFVSYLRLFYRPLRRISRTVERVARATAAGERVLAILATESTIEDSSDALAAPRFAGKIGFERVSFSHRPGRAVLRAVSLEIGAGERVAIVGRTGAGKSTLVSLIPRFYEPDTGRVCIDGTDIREFTLASLRKQISLVFQEPVLFATTIAENIAYGRPNATRAEIAKAARRSGIARVIESLPLGYDTVVGERGGTLSGGQRQCIAIARAMIRDAPIVIMDEPTAGLDGKSAALVMKAVERLMRCRTVILISHDLHNVRNVDRVVVMDRGRIVQHGPYAELATRDGAFRELDRRNGAH